MLSRLSSAREYPCVSSTTVVEAFASAGCPGAYSIATILKTMVRTLAVAAVSVGLGVSLQSQQSPPAAGSPDQDGSFRFRSAVELINVTATVSDVRGRFVAGLRQEDFLVYEDDQPQAVTHFSSERVPVSLGIALDTSESMSGEKIREARSAIDRLLEALAEPQDEFFLYRFSNRPMLIQEWTAERSAISGALASAVPAGRTAMYDAIAEAIPLAQQGRNQKKGARRDLRRERHIEPAHVIRRAPAHP
jgi:Ca-activated chloride channel family protein